MPRVNELKLPTVSAKRQIENKEIWNSSRSIDDADFFTVGYSGRTLDALVDILKSRGVQTLIDIRTNPVSMYRPEVSKANLKRTIEEHGINYEHLPALGVPRDIRAQSIKAGSREVIWKWYDEFVAEPYVGQNLHHFLNSVEHPVALMCTELDPHECHRHRLSLTLEEMGLSGFDL